MKSNLFITQAMNKRNPKWKFSISRCDRFYNRKDDIRSEFSRDYNRILHSTAYRRLKHKTQVFFATSDDHICTRIEHVNIVSSVSYTIAKFLGLNTELTGAIAIGHDLGHAPFGHEGEKSLKYLAETELSENFWHERNSLRFVDHIETLEGPDRFHSNLNLTYAVRDGIICHCGEVTDSHLFPRDDQIDLSTIDTPNSYAPFTWEGCVVKASDNIAYLGRDIDDAISLGILPFTKLKQLRIEIQEASKNKIQTINNTAIMHSFIINLCRKSSPSEGILFSKQYFKTMQILKSFCYDNIYTHPKIELYKERVHLTIDTIYKSLERLYDANNTLSNIKYLPRTAPLTKKTFSEWMIKYGAPELRRRNRIRYKANQLYNISSHRDYKAAIIDYISGMTDQFALKVYEELISF